MLRARGWLHQTTRCTHTCTVPQRWRSCRLRRSRGEIRVTCMYLLLFSFAFFLLSGIYSRAASIQSYTVCYHESDSTVVYSKIHVQCGTNISNSEIITKWSVFPGTVTLFHSLTIHVHTHTCTCASIYMITSVPSVCLSVCCRMSGGTARRPR